jgi:hypothetical protein
VTPTELSDIESRLRDAYTDAAATFRRDELHPYSPERQVSGRYRLGRAPVIPVVPLAVATAVLLIAVAAVVVPLQLHTGSKPPPGTEQATDYGPPTPQPGFLVTMPDPTNGGLVVRNAVTGKVTATVLPNLSPWYWYSLAAQGPRTFVASADIDGSPLGGQGASDFYRVVLSKSGTVSSIRRVGRPISGIVLGATITPDGRYIGYLLLTTGMRRVLLRPGLYGLISSPTLDLVIRNLVSGKVTAHWPVPAFETILSLAIDAAGNALAISAYHYDENPADVKPDHRADLVQWTSVLRLATSGTAIGKLPRIEFQAGPLALSPHGRTLYEIMQAGRVTGHSWASPKPVTFELVAIDVATGAVVSVLHTWRAVWQEFMPLVSLAPGGRYLLIADGTRLAVANVATRRYRALHAAIKSFDGLVTDMPGQGGAIGPVSW